MMKIVAIIQARMSSSRLPGKVLMDLPYGSGTPALAQVVRRLQAANRIDEVVVATTDSAADQPIVEWTAREKVNVWRGSEEDVLQRVYQAAVQVKADHVVRITADCPCLDPAIVDAVIQDHFSQKADFTSSGIKRSFPIGIDLSIFSFQMLEEAHSKAQQPYEREHVTPYFYKSHPDRFKINVYRAPEHYFRPDLRLTLDTKADYHFLCAVFDGLYNEDPLFPLAKILDLLEQKPWLPELNSHALQKQVYISMEEELKALIEYAEARGMSRVQSLLKDRLGQ